MSLLRKKSWWQQIAASPLSIAVLLGLSLVFAFAVYDRYVVEREMAERRARSEAELIRESERRDELSKKVERLHTEQGIEAEIRKNFDVAREGETVVVLVEEDRSNVEPIPTDDSNKGFWRRFWQMVLPW